MPRLARAFFARESVSVARDLIGARLLVAEPGAPRLEGVIVETEAYLNLMTEDAGIGAAVLLRALRPVIGLETMRRSRGASRPLPDAALCRGPGNLCRALGIDRAWDGRDLCASDAALRLYAPSESLTIGVSRRIGVSGDAVAREALWRFFALGEAAVSRHPG